MLPVNTDRLLLRAFTADDLAAFHRYRRLPEVARYLYRPPLTEQQARELIGRSAALIFGSDGDVLALAVIRVDTATLIGEVVLKLSSVAAEQAEVGYNFDPAAAGHGYATEAARAMLTLAFEHFGFHRVFARVDAGNAGSVGVLTRLGMRREAHLVENDRLAGQWADELVYAMLDREWRPAARGS